MALFGRSPRITGEPTSSNGAASSHLWWEPGEPANAVAATLEILVPPVVDRLYFWALQATFVGEGGRRYGAGHLGLQWHPGHPGSTAVNWGGYSAMGGELHGTESPLPSEPQNPNTRDFVWVARRRYRLEIGVGEAQGAWWGSVTDVGTGEITQVRQLLAGGTALADPVCWAEVFARCDHPSVSVRWSDLAVRRDDLWQPIASVRTGYQSTSEGGCDNTDIGLDGAGVVQTTSVERSTPPDAELTLP